MPSVSPRDPLPRFWSKVQKSEDPEGCWLWTGALNEKGYGFFKVEPKQLKAHRFAYEQFVGPIPEGLQVNHHCDNPACVRPDHLYVGTQQENRQDAVRRGRTATGERNGMYTCPESRTLGDRNGQRKHPERTARGERVTRARLKEADIPKIRALLAEGGHTLRAIGERFGVREFAIYAIREGMTWKHVKND